MSQHVAPESDIRSWLQSSDNFWLYRKPPASPPPNHRRSNLLSPSHAAPTSAPPLPPRLLRNDLLIEKLRKSDREHNGESPELQRRDDVECESSIAFTELDEDEESAVGTYFKLLRRSEESAYDDDGPAYRDTPSRVSKSPPDDSRQHQTIADNNILPTEIVPRTALSVSPSPRVVLQRSSHELVEITPGGEPLPSISPMSATATPMKPQALTAPASSPSVSSPQRKFSQVVVSELESRVALLLHERDVMASLLRSHFHYISRSASVERLRASASQHLPPPASKHSGTMTAPFVGFPLQEFLSFEFRRLRELEAMQRNTLEWIQERNRIKEIEYPCFRRVAHFTVSKLEKLFLKQERELNAFKVRGYASDFSGNETGREFDADGKHTQIGKVIQQLDELCLEVKEVVLPALATAPPAVSPSSSSLETVTTLLLGELQSIRFTLNQVLGGQGNTVAARSEEQGLQSQSHGNMTRVVQSLITQNETLLEALQLAESCGFRIPDDLLKKLSSSVPRH